MLSFSSSTEWWLPFPIGHWISIASIVFLKLAGRFTAWSWITVWQCTSSILLAFDFTEIQHWRKQWCPNQTHPNVSSWTCWLPGPQPPGLCSESPFSGGFCKISSPRATVSHHSPPGCLFTTFQLYFLFLPSLFSFLPLTIFPFNTKVREFGCFTKGGRQRKINFLHFLILPCFLTGSVTTSTLHWSC